MSFVITPPAVWWEGGTKWMVRTDRGRNRLSTPRSHPFSWEMGSTYVFEAPKFRSEPAICTSRQQMFHVYLRQNNSVSQDETFTAGKTASKEHRCKQKNFRVGIDLPISNTSSAPLLNRCVPASLIPEVIAEFLTLAGTKHNYSKQKERARDTLSPLSPEIATLRQARGRPLFLRRRRLKECLPCRDDTDANVGF